MLSLCYRMLRKAEVQLKLLHIENFMKPGERVTVLDRIHRQFALYDEAWLQRLVHDNPGLLSSLGLNIGQFGSLIPVVREFHLSSGRLDNLFVTTEGVFVLIEVKLRRNAESRQRVRSQILRYGADFAQLDYEAVISRIAKNPAQAGIDGDPLLRIFGAVYASDAGQSAFKERVRSALHDGNFCLVILTDEIQDGLVESLSDVQDGPAIGLVEVNLSRLPDLSVVAFSKIILQPTLVKSNVLKSADSAIRRDVVSTSDGMTPHNQKIAQKSKLSREEFLGHVRYLREENYQLVKEFLDSLTDANFVHRIPDRNLIVEYRFEGGEARSVLSFYPAHIEFWQFAEHAAGLGAGWEDIVRRYMAKIVELIPNAHIRQHKRSFDIDVKFNGGYLPIEALEGRVSTFSEIFRDTISDAEIYLSNRDRNC